MMYRGDRGGARADAEKRVDLRCVAHGAAAFTGADAVKFLEQGGDAKHRRQKVGQSRYSLVCNDAGGMMDDMIVSRDKKNWLMVCNARNRDKLVKHFHQVRQETGMDLDIADQTEGTVMVAVQGPKVIDRLAGLLPRR